MGVKVANTAVPNTSIYSAYADYFGMFSAIVAVFISP